MAFNSDAYIANLMKQGFTRSEATSSARYEAQAQAYITANPTSAAANQAARASTEAYASPFSTAFGGTAPSTELDAARQYASPFSTVFGGTAPTFQSEVNQQVSQQALPKVTATPKTSPFDAASDAILAQTLKTYGMEGVAQTIAQIRGEYPEISSENLLLLLKSDTRYNAEYLKRFAGNAKLKAAGLPTLDDASYLKAEDEYKKIFTAYGATTLANKDYYATLIGNRMDAVDVTNRLNEGYAALKASPDVMNAFKQFYSAATDGDILAILMDEKTQLPIIQQKVRAAEIGGAALKQNLRTSLVRANELEGAGITQATAVAGYSTIAQGMADFEKILEINNGKDVKTADVQTKLEESRLLKSAEAIKEEQAAIGVELGRFSGSAGRFASKDRAQGLI